MVTRILAMAKTFAVQALTEEEEETLNLLCQAALDAWKCRLLPAITVEECEVALIPACAWTALAGFLVGSQAADPLLSFTAGELSVRYGETDKKEAGNRLLTQAERLMASYTKDEHFCFRGVRG